MKKNLLFVVPIAVVTLACAQTAEAFVSGAGLESESNATPVLRIDAGKVTGNVSPSLYGLMTEEINYSYEGGLYGELVRNRSFKADAVNVGIKPADYDPSKYYPVHFAATNTPKFWTAINSTALLDTNTPLNDKLNVSCKVDVSKASKEAPAGIANGGYWGIPVRPNTTYHASFYARAEKFSGPLKITLQSADGKTTFAQGTIGKISGHWKKYEVDLTTGAVQPSKDNMLVITTTKSGTMFSHHGAIWFQQVSLFPPTYNNRANGNRQDISELLAGMQPKFLRFPGGNYVEGDFFNQRFNWKETIGPVEQRPGHRSCWGYWSTDGMGLLEFLGWCEDLHMQPVLAVFAGYALRHDYIPAGAQLQPYVQEALEEIEYVTGDTNTKWGAQRAKDGHPEPFKLNYVEVGNEDWFDRSGSYDGRFAQFYDAIKAKYPQLQLIATAKVKSRVPDLLDEHYYRSQEDMEAHALDYDNYSRADKTKIFVGEWATRVGSPTPNLAGALGDAAWMTGMERNSDIVLISCYAPLFVNVSDLGAGRSMQWKTDLIGYDALNSYGSPAYYAQKMFSTHHGDEILATGSENIPTRTWQPRGRGTNMPPAQQLRKVFFDATRDSKSGTIYVKVVNSLGTAQPVKIELNGARNIQPQGKAIVLKGSSPDDTNTLQEPTKIVPAEETVSGLSADFTREFPPYSITVLELKTK